MSDFSLRTNSTTAETASLHDSVGQDSDADLMTVDDSSTSAGDSGGDSPSGTRSTGESPHHHAPRDLQPLAPLNELDILPDVDQCDSFVTVEDYKKADYRGFVFVVHPNHGLMLLHCTRKKSKGPHHQLPGGHVDEPEFLSAAHNSRDPMAQLLIAAQMGAARELYEETGIDMREKLYRLEPAALRNELSTDKKDGKFVMTCEMKKRLYFFLPVTDEDFLPPHGGATGLTGPMTKEGNHLRLQLSHEHSGFMFEKDPVKSAKLLEPHSGGNGSKALLMAMKRDNGGGALVYEETLSPESPPPIAKEQGEEPVEHDSGGLVEGESTPGSPVVIAKEESSPKKALEPSAPPPAPLGDEISSPVGSPLLEKEGAEQAAKRALELPPSARKSRSARIQKKIRESMRLLDKRVHPNSSKPKRTSDVNLTNLDVQKVKSLDLLPPPSRHNIFGWASCWCIDNFFDNPDENSNNPDENSP